MIHVERWCLANNLGYAVSIASLLCLCSSANAVTLTGGEGDDNITGTELADTINGRAGNDYIDARGGNDTVYGGDNDDTIRGGNGDDKIDGGTGVDQVYGDGGNDDLRAQSGSYIYGGEGNDYTYGCINCNVDGGNGDDGLQVVTGIVHGGDGNDGINAETDLYGAQDPASYNTELYGDAGDDYLASTVGVVKVMGGDGNDTVSVRFPGRTTLGEIDGGAGRDIVAPFYANNNNLESHCVITDLQYKNFESIRIEDAPPPNICSQVTLVGDFSEPGTPTDVTFQVYGIYTNNLKLDASGLTVAGIAFQYEYPYGYPIDLQTKATVTGTLFADTFKLGGGADAVFGGGGDDVIDGGNGSDTASFSGNFADYVISEQSYNTFTVQDGRQGSPDGTDTIVDVNKLQFSDQTVDVVIRGLYIVGDDTSETLTGGGEADYINGAGGSDQIIGGGGNDTILGATGNDALDGGAGADIVNGGDGTDTASYSGSPAAVIVNLGATGNNTGDAAGDTYTSIENVLGSTSNDSLTGDADGNVIEGGAGSDTINGGAGNDTLNGDTGALSVSASPAISFAAAAFVSFAATSESDTLIGGKGNDTINGGGDADTAIYSGNLVDYTVSYNSSTQVFTVTDKIANRDGTDTVISVENFQFADVTTTAARLMVSIVNGTAGNDTLTVQSGMNELYGLAGNDTLKGGIGSDLLDGGEGADIMSGGNGDDTYYVDNPGDKVKESAKLGSGIDTVYISLSSYTIPTNVENVIYIGVGNFSGKGNKSSNRMTGGSGADTLDGQKGIDVMIGEGGNDTFIFDSPSDLALEETDSGVDTVISSVTITTLNENVENLILKKGNINGTGNALDNIIWGSTGTNVLSGGDGVDVLVGGMGNDTYYGETSASPGNDSDTISFSGAKGSVFFSLSNTAAPQVTKGAGTDRIYDNSSIENLEGGLKGDTLTGSLIANVIQGGEGDDSIFGLDGADALYGNAGLDKIDCGADSAPDRVGYIIPSDSPVGTMRDQLTNFNVENDLIDMSLIDANINTAEDQAFSFSNNVAAPNSVWFTVVGSDIVVSGDVNGDAGADFEVLIKGVGTLTGSQLLL
jgi:Ca2+-binding RTX toxin-like protein